MPDTAITAAGGNPASPEPVDTSTAQADVREALEVTQADRDAAVEMLNHAFRNVGVKALRSVCPEDIYEHFARHRLAATVPTSHTQVTDGAKGEAATRAELDAWLNKHCGSGLPYGDATDEAGMLHGLAYVLRAIESASTYKVNIGQCNSATSALRLALDHFARRGLAAAPPVPAISATATDAMLRAYAPHTTEHDGMLRAIWAKMSAAYSGVPAISGEGEKLREAIETAKTRAWDVYGVKWHYLEEISRFELVFAALATPDAVPIGSAK